MKKYTLAALWALPVIVVGATLARAQFNFPTRPGNGIARLGNSTQTGGVAVTAFESTVPVSTTAAGGEIIGQTYTIPANTLSANGQQLHFKSYYQHAANANSVTMRVYFNGSALSGASTSVVSSDNMSYDIYLMRLTSSTLQYTGYVMKGSGLGAVSGNVSGLDFTTGIIIKSDITGAVSDGDITATGMRIEWLP